VVGRTSASNLDRVRSALSRVDWDFPGAGTAKSSLHAIHWFPGNFIPQIPRFLTQLLSLPGDLVYDPFCGTGTTPIEAALQNRFGLGSDASATALHVAAGKKALLESGDLIQIAAGRAQEALTWPHLVASRDPGNNREGSNPELLAWYHPHTLDELRGIWRLSVECVNNQARPALEVVFTDTLFACASTGGSRTSTGGTRRHHWGWIADNVKPKTLTPQPVVDIFQTKLNRLLRVALRLRGTESAQCSIVLADARQLPMQKGCVDLVVTSPPYLGMIDYTLAARLTHLWYNWPMVESQRREIGARYRRGRADARDVYAQAMSAAAGAIGESIRPGGYCAIIIGASRRFPLARDSAVASFGSSMELIWGPTVRRPTRRRVSERAGREVEEVLCVYQRPE